MTERRLWALAAAAAALGLALWLVIAIGGPSGAAPPTVSLTYEATVDATGVEPVAGGGWRVTTDLGFDVTVERFALSTWSAVVTACDEESTSGATALADLVTIDTAAAAHDQAPDPAQATGPVEQDLAVATDPADLGDGVITADAVCSGHVAVAGGEGTGTGRTEPTIEVSGTYVAPDSDTAVPFSVTTDQAWGGAMEVERTELSDGALSVLVVRDLGTVFDGVDFTLDEDELATAALRALAAATRLDPMPAT